MELTIKDEGLAALVKRILEESKARVLEYADESWGTNNIEAMTAFQAMKTAELERQNLRSMQAWIAVVVARKSLYLDMPPTEEHPNGLGSLKEFLDAAGIKGSTKYDLDGLGNEVAPLLEEQGYEVGEFLNKDRYPKLAEAIPRFRSIARGEDVDYTVPELVEDVRHAQSRDEVRRKWRQQRYVARGSVNKNHKHTLVLIMVDEENLQSVLSSLNGKVNWDLTSVMEDNGGELAVTVLKEGLCSTS
jgi:hypothetical protein